VARREDNNFKVFREFPKAFLGVWANTDAKFDVLASRKHKGQLHVIWHIRSFVAVDECFVKIKHDGIELTCWWESLEAFNLQWSFDLLGGLQLFEASY